MALKNKFIEHFQEIGTLRKVYGKSGTLRCQIELIFLESFNQSQFIFLDLDGSKVPFLIESKEGSGSEFSLNLKDINSPEAAATLAGKVILLPLNDSIKSIKNIKETDILIGFKILDQNESIIGKIQKIEEYPQQLMAIVHDNLNEYLIPLNEELILGIDQNSQTINMTLPEGLLDLGIIDESE